MKYAQSASESMADALGDYFAKHPEEYEKWWRGLPWWAKAFQHFQVGLLIVIALMIFFVLPVSLIWKLVEYVIGRL